MSAILSIGKPLRTDMLMASGNSISNAMALVKVDATIEPRIMVHICLPSGHSYVQHIDDETIP